jgi:hypothetical protein
MKVFLSESRRTDRSGLRLTAVAMLSVITFASATVGTANAAQPSQTVVPPPSVIEVVEAEANRFRVTVDFGSGFSVQGEYVSGPTLPGGPAVRVQSVDGGRQQISNLVPDSDYVVRFRRTGFFDRATNRFSRVTSDWTTFSFRSLTLEQSRPSAPVISEGRALLDGLSNPYLEVVWAPSVDNASTSTQIRYIFSVNDGPYAPTCQSLYTCFNGVNISPFPALGTRIRVIAIDAAGNQSLPSNELIVTKTADGAVRP